MAWQSTAVALTAIIVGVPLGVVLGRVTWAVFANNLGVDPNARVTLAVVMLAVAGVIVGTALIAVAAAATARRTRVAAELHAG